METFWARLKIAVAWIRSIIYFESRAEAPAYLFEFIEILSRYAGDPQPSTLTAGDKHSKPESHKTPCPGLRVNIRFGRERFVDAYSIGSEPIGRP